MVVERMSTLVNTHSELKDAVEEYYRDQDIDPINVTFFASKALAAYYQEVAQVIAKNGSIFPGQRLIILKKYLEYAWEPVYQVTTEASLS
ncbi:MAG: hypothetical protein H6765_00955 [Candidatus Peribacteria bacterium]|nr:MAG: hypothetical protein H6765_00955 [Candidatus Peribacteria bacterium]